MSLWSSLYSFFFFGESSVYLELRDIFSGLSNSLLQALLLRYFDVSMTLNLVESVLTRPLLKSMFALNRIFANARCLLLLISCAY